MCHPRIKSEDTHDVLTAISVSGVRRANVQGAIALLRHRATAVDLR